MEKDEMRVFLGLVNYGTQAGMFAKGLRNAGVNAVSVVAGDSYFQRMIDINISNDITSRNPIIRRIKRFRFFWSSFWKYNVFHFFFGRTLLPYNLDAPFYKLLGKKIVMEYLGTDVDLWLGYNGVDWRGRPVDRVKLVKRVYRQAKQFDRQIVCSPVYYEQVDNSVILPLALDLSDYSFHEKQYNVKELTFMHCPTNRMAKKSDYIEAALDRLRREGYKFDYKCVMGVSHAQLKEEFINSDVIIDQLNNWYGTVSVEAMALGRPVVAGYYPHLCYYDERYLNMPIINANPHNVYYVLKDILDGKYDLKYISHRSREFVEKVHSLDVITNNLIDLYKSL